MDISKLTPMMQQYWQVKENYMDCILFYRLGDFYEMFFDDAITASKVLEIALTARNAGLEEKAPMCGIPYHAADSYIKKLIDNNYKVAICEQTSEPNQKKIVDREVVKIISPGTNLDLDSNDYNYIMYLDDSQPNYYYLALADLSTGKLKAKKTIKNKQHLYNEIYTYNIKEVVVSNKFDTSIFNELLKSYKFLISFVFETDVSDNEIIDNISIEYQFAFKQLLAYLELLQKSSLNYFFDVEYENNDFLKIDFNSKFNLELITTIKNNTKYGTLYGYLDKTKTAMGSRLLKEFIEQPLIDINKIQARQDFIDALLSDYIKFETIGKKLNRVYDLARLSSKLGLQTITPKELLWLKNSLLNTKEIIDLLNEYDFDIIKDFISNIDLVKELLDLIDEYIEEAILENNNEKIIKDDVDSLLDEYRLVLKNSSALLLDFENRQKKLTGIKNLKIGYNKVFGYYIEVSNSNKHLIKDEYNYQRKQTLANNERYINSELKEQETLILNAQENLVKHEQQLFNDFKQKITIYTKKLQKLSQDIAYLDVMHSLTNISKEANYSKPIFNHDFSIDIKDSFHPIIKKIDSDLVFINNDYSIDNDTNILLITGPNMGGKSTYMRQLSLIVILAQIGCYVPAKYANLMIFKQIFTRIGASDDLVKGQSTFMVEMLEASNAILKADEHSLILFDELGRGTATYDGIAIAYAILEYLASNKKGKTLFSTHYHELTSLDQNHKNIKNLYASVIENKQEITFTYKIKEGSIDKSYGVHVAQLANMPQAIIQRAYQLLEAFENEDNKINVNEVEYIKIENNKYDELIKQIKNTDIDNLSPIQALIYLEQIKKEIGDIDG